MNAQSYLAQSLSDRLARLEEAQSAPAPFKAPPMERQLQEFAKSHPMPKPKAPIFPDGQAVYPKGLPLTAKAAPPKCPYWHAPMPKGARVQAAANVPRPKERGEAAMITHSINQHFSIPGNQNVLIFPGQATNAQHQALDELGYQERAYEDKSYASGDAEERLYVLSSGDVKAAHEAVTKAKAVGSASSLAPDGYVLRPAITGAKARSLDAPLIQAKVMATTQNRVSFSDL